MKQRLTHKSVYQSFWSVYSYLIYVKDLPGEYDIKFDTYYRFTKIYFKGKITIHMELIALRKHLKY